MENQITELKEMVRSIERVIEADKKCLELYDDYERQLSSFEYSLDVVKEKFIIKMNKHHVDTNLKNNQEQIKIFNKEIEILETQEKLEQLKNPSE